MVACLSVRQPWADLILSGTKDIENRTWRTRFRGMILIHAPRLVDWDAVPRVYRELGLRSAEEYTPVTRSIVGVTYIVGCVERHRSRFFDGPFGFILERSRRFPRAIPYAGKLGIFDVPERVLVQAGARI